MNSRTLRTLIFGALDMIGFSHFGGQVGPRILLYHGATSEKSDGIFNYRDKFVRTDAFDQQIAWMKQRFEILPLKEFISSFKAGLISERALAITFDDGYRNNYTDAYPVLKKHGVPATFFITTGFVEGQPLSVDRIEFAIGTTDEKTISLDPMGLLDLQTRHLRIAADMKMRSHMKKLEGKDTERFLQEIETTTKRSLKTHFADSPYSAMTWEQMLEMEAGGMTFAPHTKTHPILSRLSVLEAVEEIRASKDTLEQHALHPLRIFAYPNGGKDDFTAKTIELVESEGFGSALTTAARTVAKNDNPFTLPRYTMDGASDIHRARLMTSGAYYRLIS
jgi:peptidoglycan/xylan/chitin deacetylase (PgdA/CDA1 family)